MIRSRKIGLYGAGALLAVVSLAFAAQQGPGILFPDWSEPTKGTWENPAAELGKKVPDSRPWSVTTYTSSIEGKVLEGKPMTVVGEIVDLSCYLQVGKRGDKHRDCGQKCAEQGQPIGLLTKDGSLFILMDEEHNPRRDGLTNFRKAAIENMAYVVTVHGTFSEVAGQKALYVQGYLTEG
ncbi:hypothetical protein [Tautonia marina]|uniref:hypothetical protein n=1 Tax=Tautonia marina TaxID=2653855 RepID=UPI0012610951|nr:hypothetical protein [Tautonia marina]